MTDKKRKQSDKLPISFKNNIRDKAIYDYLISIRDTWGISTYVKMLIEQDMKNRGIWKYY